jgi:hypothetical protein
MVSLSRVLFGVGPEAGDTAPDDDWLDAAAWAEERGDHQLLGLASVRGGRVMWDQVLAGVPNVKYVDGWKSRGAPTLVPVANLWHWTAAKPTRKRPAPSLFVCRDGRAGIPGPLANIVYGLDGTIWVVASGRANHAGMMHQPLLARMRAGDWPKGTAAELRLRDTGGSGGALIGHEVEFSGSGVLAPAQLAAIGSVVRATRRHLGFNEAQAVAWHHKAVTKRKIDLDAGNMIRIRKAAAA